MPGNQFVGTWRLVSIETRGEDGTVNYPLGPNPVGYLVYAEDGYMSVGFGSAARPRFASADMARGTPEEKAAAFDSYLSYSGRYEVRGDRVIHHVEVCSFPNWVGGDQERIYHLEGKSLSLSTPPILRGGRKDTYWLVWERARS